MAKFIQIDNVELHNERVRNIREATRRLEAEMEREQKKFESEVKRSIKKFKI